MQTHNVPDIVKEIYVKNLKFFERTEPNIYNIIKNLELEHSSVTIDESGNLDLIYKDKSIYGNSAIQYCEDEVAEFQSIYNNNTIPRSISSVYPNLYCVPRFFQRRLNSTIKEMFEKAGPIDINSLHHSNNFDLIVVTGVGLGLHISELVERCDIQNLIIYESDYELIKLSSFFTDWEELNFRLSKEKGRSLRFVITNKMEDDNNYAVLWNELITHPPHFPYNTVFYNHGRSEKYGSMIKKIESDQRMFLSLWGHYDDEINQANHILNNLHNNVTWVPTKDNFTWTKPVIICGSGPSLDDRIHQLKDIREKCILLSSGTALRPLLKHGIIPDYQVEIESDYIVSEIYDWLDDKDLERLKEITLLCGIQSNHKIFNYFKNTLVYAKDSLALGNILEEKEDLIIDPTPTCTNASLAIAVHYKAKTIYLFGTDFGFYDESKHHSSESEYHIENEKNKTTFKQEAETIVNNNFIQPGYLGDCLTTNMYFTSKRRIEMCLRLIKTQYKCDTFNMADGLIIEGTIHLDKEAVISIPEKTENQNILDKSRIKDKEIIHTILNSIEDCEKEISETLIKYLKNIKETKFDLSRCCWEISNYISNEISSKYKNQQYMYRGAIWHFLLSGYSTAYSTRNGKHQLAINIWKKGFSEFLKDLPDHSKKFLSCYSDNQSIALNSTIMKSLD